MISDPYFSFWADPTTVLFLGLAPFRVPVLPGSSFQGAKQLGKIKLTKTSWRIIVLSEGEGI